MSIPAHATGNLPQPETKPLTQIFAPDVLSQTAAQARASGPIAPAPISYDPLSGYQGASLTPTFNTSVLPYAPNANSQLQAPDTTKQATLYLVAKLAKGMPNLTKGLTWHVYEAKENTDGSLNLIQTVQDSDCELRLEPGRYLVHTAYGNVTTVTRYDLTPGVTTGTILLNAGGIRLDAAFAKDLKVPRSQLRFDIYDMTYDSEGNRKKIASNIKAGALIPVAAGTYHIVSRYGEINAKVRADIHVGAGKLTEAMLYMKAGSVTLKLVDEHTDSSLANTAWTVLTSSGDKIASGNGAYLDLTLASGRYQVIAQNSGHTFKDNFDVLTGDFEKPIAIKAIQTTQTN
ncbi:hypothetical protein [Polycladidibacter stylochi]|uniref:hypothetical protein n=1 Tax=Polycladidibacter stylochi TaxID=1807766 RepID=UPI0012E3A206|nr:hypothetical protein [Pseudovibrio stylochi]